MTDPLPPEGRELADAMPHIVWTHDADGLPEYFNRAWHAYTGRDLAAVLRDGAASFVHPADRDAVVALFAEARAAGAPVEATYRLRRHDGSHRWHLARVAPLQREGERVARWVGTAVDVDQQRRVDRQRAYLADAGRVLGSSLDVKQTLGDVARMVVPELADWCSIDLLRADGGLDRAAVAHVDPAKVSLAHEMQARMPPRREDPHGVYAVLGSGKTDWMREIPAALIDAIPDDALREVVRALGLRSSMCVPLVGRSRTFGAITLVAAESERLYDESDVAFAEEVAGRIAIAIENAQLYAEVEGARRAAEAMAADIVAQSRAVEEALVEMRAERDAALARLADG